MEANKDQFREVKDLFKEYLLNVHQLQHEATANSYLKSLDKVQDWFIRNKVVPPDYQIWDTGNNNVRIKNLLTTEYKKKWHELNQEKNGWYGTPWNRWLEFLKRGGHINNPLSPLKTEEATERPNDLLKTQVAEPLITKQEPLNLDSFRQALHNAGLIYSDKLVTRFVSSLVTKPFVILTGLSGSGKTKLAQAFTLWISQDESQYCIVPVGADWTNREPLLGYPNALKPEEYVKPDNGVLDLIMQANEQPDLPFFLILDEMNLSHVERYFADFLSVMESKESIPLFAEGTVNNAVPANLSLPPNLFIIGTVNIDETTNMFSPKVLDRANTIEFRVTEAEIAGFLNNMKTIDMAELTSKGASMGKSFLATAGNRGLADIDLEEINKTMVAFFGQLKKTGAEFGYRSASEILRLINQLTALDASLTTNEKIDIAIMQKLLPKLHGSRRKLCPVLVTLGGFCVTEELGNVEKNVFEKEDFIFENTSGIKYPLSLEKIARMHKGAVDNGFASFAEA